MPFSGIQAAFYAIAALPIMFGVVLIVFGVVVLVKCKHK